MQCTTLATAIYGFDKNLSRFFPLRRPAVPEFVSFGWAALSAWKSRCASARSVEAPVSIRHDLHRRGIGRALMLDLIERAQAAGHPTSIGGACTDQAASLALQESFPAEVPSRSLTSASCPAENRAQANLHADL